MRAKLVKLIMWEANELMLLVCYYTKHFLIIPVNNTLKITLGGHLPQRPENSKSLDKITTM